MSKKSNYQKAYEAGYNLKETDEYYSKFIYRPSPEAQEDIHKQEPIELSLEELEVDENGFTICQRIAIKQGVDPEDKETLEWVKKTNVVFTQPLSEIFKNFKQLADAKDEANSH